MYRKMPEPPNVNWGAQDFNVCSAVSYFSTLLGSIIGAGWLSFRVRDGSGRFPAAMAAVTLFRFVCAPLLAPFFGGVLVVGWVFVVWLRGLCVVSFRPVSASSLSALLRVQVWSIDPVFCGGPYPT